MQRRVAKASFRALERRRAGEERAPAKPVILRSASLEASFDATDGLPFEYRLLKSGIRFKGEGFAAPLYVRLCRRKPWGFAEVAARPTRSRVSERSVDFSFSAMYAPNAAGADFTLRYTIEDCSLLVTLEDVREHDGFELISIAMPSLVSVDEDERDAWLAHGDAGGDVVALREAKAGKLGLEYLLGRDQWNSSGHYGRSLWGGLCAGDNRVHGWNVVVG